MEIDSSATDVNGGSIGNHKLMITSPDSYVSTSDPAEPTSRAQVLEELRARIRELEGTQLKLRPSHDEEHYKCYLCKVSAVVRQFCGNCIYKSQSRWQLLNHLFVRSIFILFFSCSRNAGFQETMSAMQNGYIIK